MRTHLPALGLLALWSLWFLAGPARVQTAPERLPGFVEASRSAADWAAGVAHGERGARTRAGIEKAWSVERGQAPLPRLLVGLSSRWLARWLGPWAALCVPLFLLGLASAWLTWRLAERAGGRRAGLVALALLLFSPGFPHALHTPTPEAVIGFAWIFLAWAVVRGFESAGWRWTSLLAAGLAAASHAQGLALALAVALAAWALLCDRAEPSPEPAGLVRGPRLPWNVLALPVAAVALLYALWPLAWVDARKAFEALWLAPLKAPHPPFAFGGRLLDARTDQGPSAWMGLVDVAGRWTPGLLLGALAGAGRALRPALGSPEPSRRALGVGAAVLAASLLVSCLNGGTSYDGLRLDLSLLPLVAALAGPGLVELARALGPRPWGPASRLRRVFGWLPWAAVAVAVIETAAVLPYDRFYRSPLAPSVWSGGASGSTLEVQGALLETWLSDLEAARPGGSTLAVVPRDAELGRVLEAMKRLGRLPAGVAPAKPDDAACLGVAHLPETADAASLVPLVGDRREVIRYVLHGVPLFRVVCRDEAPKAAPHRRPPVKAGPKPAASPKARVNPKEVP